MTLAVTTFFINARHLFYGIGFIENFRKMGWKYPYMVLTLTDETYSVLCSVKYKDGLDKEKATFFIALFNHCYWIAGCTLGSIAGQLLR
jgi:4-azaleucine resistance transporter AzlC